jgi:hypothetical protein
MIKKFEHFNELDPYEEEDWNEGHHRFKRCGMCGTIIYENGVPSDIEELKNLTDEEIEKLELDWCNDCANREFNQVNQERQYVTRDMAIDAEHPEWEGMPY